MKERSKLLIYNLLPGKEFFKISSPGNYYECIVLTYNYHLFYVKGITRSKPVKVDTSLEIICA